MTPNPFLSSMFFVFSRQEISSVPFAWVPNQGAEYQIEPPESLPTSKIRIKPEERANLGSRIDDGRGRGGIGTHWPKFMDYSIEKVRFSRWLQLGLNSIQELVLEMRPEKAHEAHKQGASKHQAEAAKTERKRAEEVWSVTERSKSMLQILFETPYPPTAVHVVLAVSREALSALTTRSSGTPGLHKEITESKCEKIQGSHCPRPGPSIQLSRICMSRPEDRSTSSPELVMA
ncbi:MAG: hypothetical protein Q9218_005675 [Villophora microphyllina]